MARTAGAPKSGKSIAADKLENEAVKIGIVALKDMEPSLFGLDKFDFYAGLSELQGRIARREKAAIKS